MSNSKTYTAYTKEELTGFLRNNLPYLSLPRWTGLAELRELLWPRVMDGVWVICPLAARRASDGLFFLKAAAEQQRGKLPLGFVLAADGRLEGESWALPGKDGFGEWGGRLIKTGGRHRGCLSVGERRCTPSRRP